MLPRNLLALVLLSFLAACGGGGGGGSSGSTSTTASPTGNSSSAVSAAAASSSSASAASAASTSASNSSTPPSITASPTPLIFKFFKASSYAASTQAVSINFVGDGVLAGMTPGFTQPTWLSFPTSTLTAPSHSFSFNISVTPQNYQTAGNYDTVLRLATGYYASGEAAYVDLPIQLQLLAPPTVYAGSVSFNASTTDSSLPSHQTIALDFSACSTLSFSSALSDGNSIASSWLSTTTSTSNKTIDVGVSSIQPTGSYTAYITVNYTCNGANGSSNIPVNYTVQAGRPTVSYAQPNAINNNAPSDLIIRGQGFTLATVQDVKLGSQSAQSFSVINSTQIQAHFASISTLGSVPVQVVTSTGTYAANHNVLIKQAQTSVPYASLDLGESVSAVRYDSTQDTIIAAGSSQIFRIQLISGQWQIANKRSLKIGRFDLTPDSKYIVYATGNTLKLLDASTLADVSSITLPASVSLPQPRYTSISLHEILNDGTVLLEIFGSGNTSVLGLYQLGNRCLQTDTHYGLMTLRDNQRAAALMASNNSYYTSNFNGLYSASNNSFSSSVSVSPGFVASNRFAFSGNGRRLVLNDQLYDNSLAAIGTLSPRTLSNYSSELSPDGLKAYLVAAGEGGIERFDVSTPPFTYLGKTTFAAYVFYAALPDTLVPPDGNMIILSGGSVNSSTAETHLTIVPLP